MKLGRLPRKRNPAVPHFSALRAGIKLAPPPVSVDYTTALPADLGVMANDRLGCCTCSALYHALQVWSANANPPIDTEPDADVISLYEQACHYDPNSPQSDQGGVEQDVLTYAMLNGLPVGADGSLRHRLAAFVEIDPANCDDVKLAIDACGIAYIGLNLPDYAMSSSVWDVMPSADYQIIGGHAVVLAGYDSNGVKLISWGKLYVATWGFLNEFMDECYALADKQWIEATGKSPAGLSLEELETQMAALRQSSN